MPIRLIQPTAILADNNKTKRAIKHPGNMTEKAIVIIVLLVGIMGVLNISTEAQTAEKLLVTGYIDDNNDDNKPMCKSEMTAFAQPGNRLIGQGRVNRIRYYIELQPGWEQSNSIDFFVYDVGPTLCTSVPISNFTNAVNGQVNIDLICRFETFDCLNYLEYDHIEEQAEKYWSKVPYIGGARVYDFP